VPVAVIFDADITTNESVLTAARRLGAALQLEGATKVGFVMLAQGSNDKTGLDDLLGGRLPEKRAKTLRRLVDAAAQSLPSRVSGTRSLSMDDTRPALDVTADRLSLIREVVGVMCQRWDGWPLFNYGDVISELQDDRMVALDRGPLLYIKVLTTRSPLRSSNDQRERIRATFVQARMDAYPLGLDRN